MDLLFKRYASPFLLIEQMICLRQFSEFVKKIEKMEDDDRLWQFFLHKVKGQSFEDFKNQNTVQLEVSETNFETTINDSFDIVQGFVPDIK